ncbi:unnamed protein product [Mytilus edulis]|uniref:Uncharacterized protein n=1 Tax=Mytilus edulis TaxID=6550 RepID=A0A8S3TG13_MYTED|nr:unnamed protein product [Mytilus edulis]
MLPDGKLAFSNNSLKAIRVFNLNGTKDFEVNTRTYAFDVAYINHDNTLAVTSGESDTNCITIIDIQGKQIKKTIPVDCHHYGIGVTSEGKLICSAAGKGIQLINLHNSSITDHIVRDNQIPTCCYVAIFDDKMHQSNTKTSTITCYDLQGTVKWTFKNEKVLRGPCGISVDNGGNVRSRKFIC